MTDYIIAGTVCNNCFSQLRYNFSDWNLTNKKEMHANNFLPTSKGEVKVNKSKGWHSRRH